MTVHWVVDRSLGRRNGLGQGGEAGYEGLIDALTRTDTPYTLVRKIPFSGTLIDPDDTSPDPKEVVLDISGPVFICGTMGMKNTALQYGWNPDFHFGNMDSNSIGSTIWAVRLVVRIGGFQPLGTGA